MKEKHMIRQLKKQAEQIPKEEYEVFNKFFKPFFKDADDKFWETPAKEGEPARRPVFGMIEKYPVNHARRVKKLYKKYGMPAVDAYFFVKAGMVRQQG